MPSILVVIADPERAALDPVLIAELSDRFRDNPSLARRRRGRRHDDRWSRSAGRSRRSPPKLVAALGDPGVFDLAVLPADSRRKRLLISDMDSTMITVECIDELADFAGVKGDVAAITRRAMNGELDFAGALRERGGASRRSSGKRYRRGLCRAGAHDAGRPNSRADHAPLRSDHRLGLRRLRPLCRKGCRSARFRNGGGEPIGSQ